MNTNDLAAAAKEVELAKACSWVNADWGHRMPTHVMWEFRPTNNGEQCGQDGGKKA